MDYLKLKEAQKIIHCMNEAVWMVDKNEQTMYVNPQFCELTGYSYEELIEKKSVDLWMYDTLELMKRAQSQEKKEGIPASYEGELITKSGKTLTVLISGAPLEDGGVISVITDISPVKQSESVYRKLVEHLNEAVWMGDSNERTVYANPKFCTLVGYSLEEILGKESYMFWDDESAEKVRRVNMTHRKSGVSSSYYGNLLTKKGKKIPVLLNGTPLEDGGTIGIMTDLSELKAKEEVEKILNSAIEFSSDAVVLIDQEGMIQLWNNGAKMVFGHKKDHMIGHSLKEVFSEFDVDQLTHQAEKVIQNWQLKGVHKNKSILDIALTITEIQSEHDQTQYYLIIARDITNQRKFEEEMALKYSQIKSAYNKFGVLRRKMDYIFELIEVAQEASLKQITNFIVNAIIMLSHADACTLRVYNKKDNTMELLSYFGVGSDWEGKSSIPFRESLAEKAFRKKMPLKIIDVAKEPEYQSTYLAKKYNLCSMLLIPLQYQGEVLGTLSIYTTPEKKLEIFENDFIEQYAEVISLVLAKNIH